MHPNLTWLHIFIWSIPILNFIKYSQSDVLIKNSDLLKQMVFLVMNSDRNLLLGQMFLLVELS